MKRLLLLLLVLLACQSASAVTSPADIATATWAAATRSPVSGTPAAPTNAAQQIASVVWAYGRRTLTIDGVDTDLIAADVTGPTVTINPTGLSLESFAGTSLTLTGTAVDDLYLNTVTWYTDTGQSGSCTGTSTWSAIISLVAGRNVVTIQGTDLNNNIGVASVVVGSGGASSHGSAIAAILAACRELGWVH